MIWDILGLLAILIGFVMVPLIVFHVLEELGDYLRERRTIYYHDYIYTCDECNPVARYFEELDAYKGTNWLEYPLADSKHVHKFTCNKCNQVKMRFAKFETIFMEPRYKLKQSRLREY